MSSLHKSVFAEYDRTALCPKCGHIVFLGRVYIDRQRKESDYAVLGGVLKECNEESECVYLPPSVTVIEGGYRDERYFDVEKGCFEGHENLRDFMQRQICAKSEPMHLRIAKS